MNLHNYLIDDTDLDWSNLLSAWHWILPEEVTVWFVNRFGDVFLKFDDESINILAMDSGELRKLAESRSEFEELIDDDDNATDWLLIPLVDRLVNAGMTLRSGECYGFRQPPMLGGPYDIENIVALPVSDYLPALGMVHRQLKDLPDGTRVIIRPDGAKPKKKNER